MLKNWIGILAITALVAACAVPAPKAVQIEGTPGLAVIYLVRATQDLSSVPAQVSVGDRMLGTTYPGTYYRIEVPTGRHRIAGTGVDGGNITLDVERDRVYFVQQWVAASWRSPTSLTSSFRAIDETRARAALVGAERS